MTFDKGLHENMGIEQKVGTSWIYQCRKIDCLQKLKNGWTRKFPRYILRYPFKFWWYIPVRKFSYRNLIFSSIFHIWLIFTRRSTSSKICRWFPQIVFILLTRVRPINVGFSNRFFCLSDKRFLSIIIKNFFEEDKS